MSGWRLAQIGGLGLTVLMMVLLGIGTRRESTFVLWIVLLIVGGVIFGLARMADEKSRKRQRDEEFRTRTGQ